MMSLSSELLAGRFLRGRQIGLGLLSKYFVKPAVQTSTFLSLRVDGEKYREVEGCGWRQKLLL